MLCQMSLCVSRLTVFLVFKVPFNYLYSISLPHYQYVAGVVSTYAKSLLELKAKTSTLILKKLRECYFCNMYDTG